MIATGASELVFYDAVNNAKYKSADMKVEKLKWSYSSNCFLIILSNNSLYIWNSLNSADCTLLNIKHSISDFDLTKDDSYIVFSTNDHLMRVYDIKRQKTSGKEYPFHINASSICLSADDVMVAVSSGRFLEILNRTSKEYKKLECKSEIMKMEWSFHQSEVFKLYILSMGTLYLFDCLKQNFVEIYRNEKLSDFCLSNSMKLMYIYGSEIVKYDCQNMLVLASCTQNDANCIYFDDESCFLYVGYQHGILKCSASLQVIESISLSECSKISSRSKVSAAFEIPRLENIFTPPRQTTDSVQSLTDIPMEGLTTPFDKSNKLDSLNDLQARLNSIDEKDSNYELTVTSQISELKEEIKGDLANIHVDIIKQMHQQKKDIKEMLQNMAVDELFKSLLNEVSRLNKDNQRLRLLLEKH
eukprot:NODE_171_length_16024_cov_0.172559.p4 type:complete len:415 gc:universal NODE_171_length_16024_cov_0.172559:4238-5482(+)